MSKYMVAVLLFTGHGRLGYAT